MSCGKSTHSIAQGEFEYLRDGEPVPVFEHWELLRKGETFEVRSVREVPAISVVISARALVGAGQVQHCLLRWCDASQQKCIAAASYHRGIYRVRHAGLPRHNVEVAGALYFPLLRIFAGQLLGALAAQENAEARILVPWVHDPSQPQKLFAPEFSRRRVRHLETVDMGERGAVVDCFEYSGGQYEHGAVYRLANGLLQEYRWPQGRSEWAVRLKNLQGSWPGEELWPHAVAPAAPAVQAEN